MIVRCETRRVVVTSCSSGLGSARTARRARRTVDARPRGASASPREYRVGERLRALLRSRDATPRRAPTFADVVPRSTASTSESSIASSSSSSDSSFWMLIDDVGRDRRGCRRARARSGGSVRATASSIAPSPRTCCLGRLAPRRRRAREQRAELGRRAARALGRSRRRLRDARGDQLVEPAGSSRSGARTASDSGVSWTCAYTIATAEPRREQRRAGQHEVRESAERVDVGLGPDRARRALLRRPVQRRAEHLLVVGEPRQSFVGGELREPEIDDLRARRIAVREQHVRRFEIAMHDPLVVRERERLGELEQDPQRIGDREPDRACRSRSARSGPVDVLHREIQRRRSGSCPASRICTMPGCCEPIEQRSPRGETARSPADRRAIAAHDLERALRAARRAREIDLAHATSYRASGRSRGRPRCDRSRAERITGCLRVASAAARRSDEWR